MGHIGLGMWLQSGMSVSDRVCQSLMKHVEVPDNNYIFVNYYPTHHNLFILPNPSWFLLSNPKYSDPFLPAHPDLFILPSLSWSIHPNYPHLFIQPNPSWFIHLTHHNLFILPYPSWFLLSNSTYSDPFLPTHPDPFILPILIYSSFPSYPDLFIRPILIYLSYPTHHNLFILPILIYLSDPIILVHPSLSNHN